MSTPNITYQQHGLEPEYKLQPDYQLTDNGYGLMQLNAVFVSDASRAGQGGSTFFRGASFPGGVGPIEEALVKQKWTLVKSEEAGSDGDVIRTKAMYAAIDQITCPSGLVTQTEATITSTAVSESIESHPNFSAIQIKPIANNGSGSGLPLGGVFTNGAPPIIQPTPDPKNPNRAYWVSGQSSPGIFPWQFQGFLPTTDNTTVNRKAGVRSWFRPTITMRLTAYTSDKTQATETAQRVGWIIDNAGYGVFTIPEMYMELLNDPISQGQKNWLVTGTNLEVYGGLYKVTADLTMSGVLGWDPDIYPLESQIG